MGLKGHVQDCARSIALLGATGSIGKSTLDVLARHPDDVAVMVDADAAERLQRSLSAFGLSTRVEQGAQALEAVARDERVDTVVSAIVGAAALLPTLAAAESGKRSTTSLGAPQLVDGTEDFGRFCHLDEQGSGGHRGVPPV